MSISYLSDELTYTHAFHAVRGIRDYLSLDEINEFRKMLASDVYAEIDADPKCCQPKRILWPLEIEQGESVANSPFVITDGYALTTRDIDDDRLFTVTLCLSFDDPLRRSLPKTRQRFRAYIEETSLEDADHMQRQPVHI